LLADDIGVDGLGFTLVVNNLTGKGYFHPGVREANAGLTPGYFDSEGVWQGSQGFFNSLLPQPGRTIQFLLRLAY
jgi:hypothetical protein